MRELRSVVNALFCFLVFLMVYAFTVPGHAHGKSAPHFLRMEISDAGSGTKNADKLTFSVPYGLVRHGLKVTGARVRQEVESRFDQSMEAEEVRALWKELSEKPDSTEVTRTFDENKWVFVKNGPSLRITVGRPREKDGTADAADSATSTDTVDTADTTDTADTATITIPTAFLSRLADRDKPLDVDALLGELTASQTGSLLEIQSREGKVKVWID
jgi:hypothetical protein